MENTAFRNSEFSEHSFEQQLRRSLFQSIHALSNTIGLRAPGTPEHQHNVANICRTIGQLMGLPTRQIDGLRIGATLHDYGVIGVPLEILCKVSPLTEHEYGIIKQHPVHGYQIFRNIDFPWPVARMILQHHERLDGSGYPAGISGDEIILEARIIAVADVIESMTTDRPYRKALSMDIALEEIRRHRGKLYDPDVVDVALDLFTNKKELLDPEYYGRDN